MRSFIVLFFWGGVHLILFVGGVMDLNGDICIL